MARQRCVNNMADSSKFVEMAHGLEKHVFNKWKSLCNRFSELSCRKIVCKSKQFLEITTSKSCMVRTCVHDMDLAIPVTPRVVVDQNGVALLCVFDRVVDAIDSSAHSGDDFIKKLSSSGRYTLCEGLEADKFSSHPHRESLQIRKRSYGVWESIGCLLWFCQNGPEEKLCPRCKQVFISENVANENNFEEQGCEIVTAIPRNTSFESTSNSNESFEVNTVALRKQLRSRKMEKSLGRPDISKAGPCIDDIKRSRKDVPNLAEYNTPQSAFEFLIWPKQEKEFFDEHWEKSPLVLHRAQSSLAKHFKKLFSKNILLELFDEPGINYGKDVNCCRYRDGVRQDMNKKGRMTSREFHTLFDKEGVTLQIHQPQRHVKELWNLMEKLESYFACLVGSNVYMTPCGSQGLAPHYDDVEVFILQVEGEKHWRLYKPPVELPMDYSADFSQEEIGEPTHDFVLKPGDLLYMPRGTVHQADTPLNSNKHSTHITISTYQKHTWGDYLSTVMEPLMEKAVESSVLWRKGLPVGFLFNQQPSKETLTCLFHELANVKPVNSHLLLKDFMGSRLPPFPKGQSVKYGRLPERKSPTYKSAIKFKNADHVAFVIIKVEERENTNEDDDMESVQDGVLDECIVLYTSLFNKTKMHMMTANCTNLKLPYLKFPVHYEGALQQLRNSKDAFVRVKDLDLPDKEDKISLSLSLWSEHLISIANG